MPRGPRTPGHTTRRRCRAGAPRRAAATIGSRPVNPAANQRSAAPSTIDSIPDARTVAARTRHCSGSPITAPVHSRAADSTRSGASSRICSPTAPPTESPAYEKACPGAMSSASASTPAASSGIPNGPDAAGLRPCPGRSQPTTRTCSERRSATAPHRSATDVPSDGPSSSRPAPRGPPKSVHTYSWNGHVASLR